MVYKKSDTLNIYDCIRRNSESQALVDTVCVPKHYGHQQIDLLLCLFRNISYTLITSSEEEKLGMSAV